MLKLLSHRKLAKSILEFFEHGKPPDNLLKLDEMKWREKKFLILKDVLYRQLRDAYSYDALQTMKYVKLWMKFVYT